MNSKGDMPYIARPEYQKALNSSPDTVVIQLGTNDSKPHNWDMEQYVADYMKMVMSFMKLESKPEIFLMVPPPLYIEGICHLR
jgi:lysophospholipase L1-like esterase